MKGKLVPISESSYLPLREMVYETLRKAIVEKVFEPGDRILEVRIAEELNVSRTPVREAIRRLEQEGYLFTMYHRGTFVPSVTLRDIEEIYAIRAELEAYACGLIAGRIKDDQEVEAQEAVRDTLEKIHPLLNKVEEYILENDIDKIVTADIAFHDFLYKACNNTRLEGIINNLKGQLTQYRTVSMSTPGRLEATLEEHRAIVKAIEKGDVEAAKAAALTHMKNAEDILVAHFERRE